MPNVATDAWSIAVTVAIVERILRREEQSRLAPRIDRVVGDFTYQLWSFAQSAAIDYAGTHLRSFKPPPGGLRSLLDFWLDERGNRDACPVTESRVPLILHAAGEVASALERLRANDREEMEPEVVRAIDDVLQQLSAAHNILDLQRSLPATTRSKDWLGSTEAWVARGVRDLAEVLGWHGVDLDHNVLPPPMPEALDEHRRTVVRWHGHLDH